MKKTIFTLFLCGLAYVGFGQALKVAADGKVGIGQATPATTLDIKDTDAKIRISEGTANQYLEMRNASSILAQLTKRNSSGNAIIDINPIPAGSSAAKFRYFRSTNTTGDVAFEVHYGDNTAGVNCKFSGNGNSFINKDFGMVGIGTNAPTHQLSVDGTAGKPGGGVWSTFSDRRLKKNINTFEEGLEQILKIEPIKFQYNGKAGINDTEKFYVGIIAQDMKEIAPHTVSKVTYQEEVTVGADEDQSVQRSAPEEYLVFDGTSLTYMLINAIKEQQKLIESQEETLVRALEQIEDLRTRIDLTGSEGFSTTKVSFKSNAELEQNRPNPFQIETQIEYSLPQNFENASIEIYDITGRLLKSVPLTQSGKGILDVDAVGLSSGLYSYHLRVDGQTIDSKKMSIQR